MDPIKNMIFHTVVGVIAMVFGVLFNFFEFEFPLPFQSLVGLILFGLGFMVRFQGIVKSVTMVK